MKKYSKAYQAYRDKFYAEKKMGNVKRGGHGYQKVLSAYQFREARKTGMTTTDILKAQTIFGSKAEKRQALSQYKRIRKTYSRGETVFHEKTYFGGQREGVEGISYHYTLSGLLKDKNALHFLISHRINGGEEREKVLADYGY